MKIVVDECLPKRVIHFFEKGTAYTVPQIGLSGAKDTDLLAELDRREIDVFVTIDGNIEYQQQFRHRKFGTVVIFSVSNRFGDLLHFKEQIVKAVHSVAEGEIIHIF